MTAKRILITGASGCIGHYFTEQLIQNTPHELFILVRNPAKLRFDWKARSGIHLLEADLRQIGQFAELLKTINVAILAATAWGGLAESYEINVTKTIALIQSLDPQVCEQVLYFSTESILSQSNDLMPEAGELGTEYIRTKYACFQELEKLCGARAATQKIPAITALFPTFVFGGDETKPYSHLTSGFQEVLNWLGLIRFFSTDASFHFLHGYDIAQVVCYLVEHPAEVGAIADSEQPPQPHKIILGNHVMTLDETIREICAYYGKRIYFQLPLTTRVAEFFIRVFRIQVAPWDRFCMRYKHFVHQNPVSPRMLGLVPYAETLTDILKIYRFGQK